jgi:hypothetical protein
MKNNTRQYIKYTLQSPVYVNQASLQATLNYNICLPESRTVQNGFKLLIKRTKNMKYFSNGFDISISLIFELWNRETYSGPIVIRLHLKYTFSNFSLKLYPTKTLYMPVCYICQSWGFNSFALYSVNLKVFVPISIIHVVSVPE